MYFKTISLATLCAGTAAFLAACGAPAGNSVNQTNTNVANSATNISNTNTNAMSNTSMIDVRAPEQYQANIQLSLETVGQSQKATMPTIGANVARMGDARSMEFALPNGEKVIYLEKAGANYVILPARKQYAELDEQAVGYEVRRLLLPEQLVEQVKNLQGMRYVGDEMLNGRSVAKYAYNRSTATQSEAGNVETESYLIIDKETGLPIRTETIAQADRNVQGYSGLKMVTQMSDLKTSPDPNMFNVPTDYQKIDPEQVRAQANLIFNTVAALIGQVVNQAQAARQPAAAPTATPAATP